MTRRSALVVGLAISVVCLFFIIRSVEFDRLAASLTQADPRYVLPMFLCFIAFYALKVQRWQLLLQPLRSVSATDLTPSLVVGFASNNVLPFRAGELIRVFLAARDIRLEKASVMGSILIERLLDLSAVLLLAAAGLLILRITDPTLITVTAALATVSLFLVAFLVAAVWVPNAVRAAIARASHPLPTQWRAFVEVQVDRLIEALTSMGSPASLAWASISSLLGWLLMANTAYLALSATNVDVPWVACLILQAIIVAGIALPSAPGFIGTLEVCFLVGLAPFGVGAHDALAAAVIYHLVTWLTIVGAGLLALRHYGLNWNALRELAQ